VASRFGDPRRFRALAFSGGLSMKTLVCIALLALFPLVAKAEDAPAKDAKSAAKNLLKPTNDPESWVFELNDAGDGEMTVDGDAIVFATTETTGTNWHVQAYQPEIDLKDGQSYVIKFQMKAEKPVDLMLVAGINEEDWHEIGLREELRPTEEFKDYEFEFKAHDTVDKNNRVGFVLGIDKGVVSVKDMTLTEQQ
jgi:Carbohydrate binding domain